MRYSLLKTERELQGWSQAKLAEVLGVTTKTIRRWEQGQVVPQRYYQEKLYVILGKTAQELGLILNTNRGRSNQKLSLILDTSREQSTRVSTPHVAQPAVSGIPAQAC